MFFLGHETYKTTGYSFGLLPVFAQQPDQLYADPFADHTEAFSHDMLNRYLAGDQITPRLVWEKVKEQVVQCANGYLVFDDTVVDKNYSYQSELVRRQYSGKAHGVIKGIGVVTGVYVNLATDQFWIMLPHLRSGWGWQDETGSCARHAGELCLQCCGIPQHS